MPHIGTTELLIVLAIVILIFGVGRVGKIGGELGKAIREFRRSVSGSDENGDKPKDDQPKDDKPS